MHRIICPLQAFQQMPFISLVFVNPPFFFAANNFPFPRPVISSVVNPFFAANRPRDEYIFRCIAPAPNCWRWIAGRQKSTSKRNEGLVGILQLASVNKYTVRRHVSIVRLTGQAHALNWNCENTITFSTRWNRKEWKSNNPLRSYLVLEKKIKKTSSLTRVSSKCSTGRYRTVLYPLSLLMAI